MQARLLLLSLVVPWLPAAALAGLGAFECPSGYGDLTGNGFVNVGDVQCAVQAALRSFVPASVGEFPPACLKGGASADTTCDGVIDIRDVNMVAILATASTFPIEMDSDQDQCPDACQTVQNCDGALCAGLECGEVTCGGVTEVCGGDCADGLVCTAGHCVLPGTCFGACGSKSPSACFCDEACWVAGDCCANICEFCPQFFPAECAPGGVCGDGFCAAGAGETCGSCAADCSCSGSLVCNGSQCVPPGLCQGACGGISALAECYCDAGCAALGDCCADACAFCAAEMTEDACAPPPPGESCVGHCGQAAPSGCYCDSDCATFGDCCADLCTHCEPFVTGCGT